MLFVEEVHQQYWRAIDSVCARHQRIKRMNPGLNVETMATLKFKQISERPKKTQENITSTRLCSAKTENEKRTTE